MATPAIAPLRNGRAGAQILAVQTLTTFQDFLDHESVWNEVLTKAEVEHPFLEHAWIRTWLECFGRSCSLKMLIVRERDEPIAIAPLVLTPIRMWGIRVMQMGFPYNAHVPRSDCIVARGRDDAYAAIWDHIRRSRFWDLLQLCQLPEMSATLNAFQSLAKQDGCPSGTWESGASPCVPLAGGWDEFYEGLPAKHRSNLRNRFKRLNQSGAERETISSVESVIPALEEGLRLEAAAWKRDAGTAIACDPDVMRFYERFAERAAERGWLRLNFLQSNSARIAFDYSLEYKNRVFLLKLGYDPAYAAYSPSNLLLSLALRDAFDRGCHLYDFLGDEADWKRCWTKISRPNMWLFVFSNSSKGRLLHRIKFRLIPALRNDCFNPVREFAFRAARLIRRKL
jgi:CelD/BcsL family acetyltransferase involved in cellulose biosynthesis